MRKTYTKYSIFFFILSLIFFIFYFLYVCTIKYMMNDIVEKPIYNGYDNSTNMEYADASKKPVYDVNESSVFSLGKLDKYKDYKKYVKSKGRLIIPSVDIDVNIYEGISDEVLYLGAGEQEPRDVVKAGSVGNYILAAHSSYYDDTWLFTPLRNVNINDIVYVTDEDNLYVYKVDLIKRVHESDTELLKRDYIHSKITVYTCADLEYKYPEYRRVVTGNLLGSYKLNDLTNDEFNYIINNNKLLRL